MFSYKSYQQYQLKYKTFQHTRATFCITLSDCAVVELDTVAGVKLV